MSDETSQRTTSVEVPYGEALSNTVILKNSGTTDSDGSGGLRGNIGLEQASFKSSKVADKFSAQFPSVFLRMPNTAWIMCLGFVGTSNMWKVVQSSPFLSDKIAHRALVLPNTLFWWAGAAVGVIVGTA